MYRKEYLVILASLLVGVVNGFGLPPPPNQPLDGSPQGDEHIYPCLTAISCVLVGTPDHDRLKECFDIIDKKDEEIAISWVSNGTDVNEFKDKYDAINILYCAPDKDTRKKRFDNIIQGAMEIYSVGCETRYDKTTCDRWEQTTDCTANLMDEIKAEGKCDLSGFE